MTKTVRGAGRKKAAASKKKHDQKDVVVGGKRDDALKRAAKKTPAKKTAAKKAPSKQPTKSGSGEPLWESKSSLGSNVDRLKTAGVTWKRIAEMANESGEHEVPWPDGGRLLRARKQFLAGTEGKPRPARAKPRTAEERAERASMSVDEKVANAMATRGTMPWDEQEMDDDTVLSFLAGRKITWVYKLTGAEASARIPKDSKHTVLREGKDGRYITFAAMEGPFLNVSLSNITHVS